MKIVEIDGYSITRRVAVVKRATWVNNIPSFVSDVVVTDPCTFIDFDFDMLQLVMKEVSCGSQTHTHSLSEN